ncbi:hypothetical protein B0T44_04385 [Nocardia donostiensis]|uniref:HTH tetR-type domain-containing protein n=2 Tax=Nocardia donostiensis TaxID=1538463 RepID=A0A1V2TH34_9NOCA|nr:hypothetical protein B0T46_10080 [Nocardia donostiensis]OQS22919.1 hypothetical protein B0T44_04385 [Nocardia donostiensis]
MNEAGAVVTSQRNRMIEAGLRLLESEGPAVLRARRIAAEVGASTMAVYTHFDGMPGLVHAIVIEAFHRFDRAMAAMPRTDDPVADLFLIGEAYHSYARAHPQRYRLMFGLAPSTPPADLTPPDAGPAGKAAFGQLVEVVERIRASGRIGAEDPNIVASRIWSLIHGAVLLELAGYLDAEQDVIDSIVQPATADLLAGMGDHRDNLDASIARARRLLAETAPTSE